MGEGRVSLTPCADFYRPVEELEYTDLLRNTFTQSGHERVFKTWRTPATHPQCVFCDKKYRWGKGEVECHMDPTITKVSTGNERLVWACAESQLTSRDPNRTRFLSVQTVIRVKMKKHVSSNKKCKCNATKWEEWVFIMCRGMKISLRKHLRKPGSVFRQWLHIRNPWPDSVRLPIHYRLMSRFPGGLSPKNTAKLDMDPV